MPDLNEARTRAALINPQLEKAGWNLSDRSQIQFEVPVQGYDPTPWNGFTDFCLYHPDGSVLAVIEAKRTARNAREGEEQLRQYVREIAAKQKTPPFGFMTNGLAHSIVMSLSRRVKMAGLGLHRYFIYFCRDLQEKAPLIAGQVVRRDT
jgi:type I site-specific restriction endonuclease